jgi:hypothetical protein
MFVLWMLAATVLSATMLLTAVPADEKPAGGSKQGKGSQSRALKPESLTGCVDQRGETYVLAGATMKEGARLSGKAFSSDNFARYIGQTVTVRGTVDRSVSPAVVDVVKIDAVSDSCKD